MLDQILHEVEHVYNLHIVPARRLSVSPIDLLTSQRMAALMAELRALRLCRSGLATPARDVGYQICRASGRRGRVRGALEQDRRGSGREGGGRAPDSGVPIAGAVLTQVDVRRHRRYSPEDVLHYYGQYKKYYVS